MAGLLRSSVPFAGFFVKILKSNNIFCDSSFYVRRRIMTTSFNASEAIDELKQNPYFEKYAGKIARLQKTSPDEFLSRLEESTKKKTKKFDNEEDKHVNEAKSKPIVQSPNLTAPKHLDDVLKMDLIRDKNPTEITEIWTEYHKKRDAVSAALPGAVYRLIKSRAANFPTFLFPLPRKQGYEFIVCQFSGNEVHFTPLISYQAHKENAAECLTIYYFPELLETGKDIVLMKGEFDKEVLNAVEAQCLTNQMHLYYGEEDSKKTALLERFTNDTDSFRHMDLVAELESIHL